MAFEGLNHAGVTDANLLVILNDNAIGLIKCWCLEKLSYGSLKTEKSEAK
jgi:hypothetical protein